MRDLTGQRHVEEEKRRIESSLRQTQKMESLGVMAGSIAHDFNNILMAILGSAETARREIAGGAPVDEDPQTITTSVEHAAELTDQLLTDAGRGTSAAAPVDLGAVAREMGDRLRSAISKKVSVSMHLAPSLPLILGDRSQMRQVILNLVTNASEALGDGPGAIALSTSVSRPGPADADGPGRVRLEVCDTGVGMDADTRGARCPEMPVVVISGYSVVDLIDPLANSRTVFLHKPFKLPGLAVRRREMIGPDARGAHS